MEKYQSVATMSPQKDGVQKFNAVMQSPLQAQGHQSLNYYSPYVKSAQQLSPINSKHLQYTRGSGFEDQAKNHTASTSIRSSMRNSTSHLS